MNAGVRGIAAPAIPSRIYRFDDIRRFGAVHGQDATRAMRTAAQAGSSLWVPPGFVCGMRQVVIDRDFEVDASNATINLVGGKAGFVFKGVSTRVRFKGGTLVGDGTNRDADVTLAQIGILIGNEVGANVINATIWDVIFDASNIGLKVAAGTGSGSGNAFNTRVLGCLAKNIVGTVGGVGYGYQFSQASGSLLANSTAANCERHGIYFAEGRNYAAVNCLIKDHRSAIASGTVRGAMAISRSRSVSVSNVVFDANNDVALVIDDDTQGTAPDNDLDGVTVRGCTFKDSDLNDIRIGTSDPATNGVPKNIVIANNVHVTKSASNNGAIYVQNADGLTITDNRIDGSVAGGSNRAITLAGTGGQAYTKNVEVDGNSIVSAGFAGIHIATAIQTGTQRIVVGPNRVSGGAAELEFEGGEAATTNTALLYQREIDAVRRTYTPSGGATLLNLAATAVISFGAGDVIGTHATNTLTWSGASSGYRFDAMIAPAADDGAPLGSTSLKFSDAFFAAGAVINFNSGGHTITEGSGQITFASATAALVRFNSTHANGAYVVWANSGTALGDIGSAAQMFSGGATTDFGINVRGNNALGLGSNDTLRVTINATGADVVGEVRGDSLRVDQAATAIGTGTKTISNAADGTTNFGKYFSFSLNGTTVYVPCGTVAPT